VVAPKLYATTMLADAITAPEGLVITPRISPAAYLVEAGATNENASRKLATQLRISRVRLSMLVHSKWADTRTPQAALPRRHDA